MNINTIQSSPVQSFKALHINHRSFNAESLTAVAKAISEDNQAIRAIVKKNPQFDIFMEGSPKSEMALFGITWKSSIPTFLMKSEMLMSFKKPEFKCFSTYLPDKPSQVLEKGIEKFKKINTLSPSSDNAKILKKAFDN